jgi:hypothetical protein
MKDKFEKYWKYIYGLICPLQRFLIQGINFIFSIVFMVSSMGNRACSHWNREGEEILLIKLAKQYKYKVHGVDTWDAFIAKPVGQEYEAMKLWYVFV